MLICWITSTGNLWITSAGFRRIRYSLVMEDYARTSSAAPEVPGYDVGRCLGRGGSATVWLVTERQRGSEYALKCFARRRRPRIEGDAEEADPARGEDPVRPGS